MLNSKLLAAAALAATLAMTARGYAQNQPDPHHPEQGAAPSEAVRAVQTGQAAPMPMMDMMNMMGGMMKMMGGGAQMGMGGTAMPGMGIAEHVEGRIAFLRAELQITDAQAKTWDDFAGVLRDNAKRLKEANMPMMSDAPASRLLAQLDSQERMLATKLERVRATKTAYASLYEALTVEQRKTVDELLQTHMGLMPPGMMQGGMMQGGMMQGGQAPAPQNMQ
jgi:hypothetical protein